MLTPTQSANSATSRTAYKLLPGFGSRGMICKEHKGKFSENGKTVSLISLTHWMMKSRIRAPIRVDPVTPRLPIRKAGMLSFDQVLDFVK